MQLFYNPFVDKKDALSVVRDDSTRFFGNTMFWKYIEKIHPKHVYRTQTVEYKSLKFMIIEAFMVLVLAILTTVFINGWFDGPWQRASIIDADFWSGGGMEVTTSEHMYEWLSDAFVPALFSHASDYPDISALLIPPNDWLLENRSTTWNAVYEEGVFEISSVNPGWDRHIVGNAPFLHNLLIGTVRIRQVAVQSLDPRDCGLENVTMCYPVSATPENLDKSKFIRSGVPSRIIDSFKFVPENITGQPTVYGPQSTYPGSGYVYELPQNISSALAEIESLREWGWVDAGTRAVIIEATTINTRLDTSVIIMILFEFNGDGSVTFGRVSRIPFVVPSWTFDPLMVLFIAVFIAITGFAYLVFFKLIKEGIYDFCTSLWNVYDVTMTTIYLVAMGLILDSGETPSILSPLYSIMPNKFMPFSFLYDHDQLIRIIVSVAAVMSWIRLIKCGVLICSRQVRMVIKIFENFLYQFLIYFPVYFFGIFGLIVGLSIVLGGHIELLQTVESSIISVFTFGSFRGLKAWPHDDIPTPVRVGGFFLIVFFLILVWIILPGAYIGIIMHEFRLYKKAVVEAWNSIDDDRGALYPPSVDRQSYWHRDIMRVFLYSWFHRARGFVLIQETEDEVGLPEEQNIDLELLPDVIQERWKHVRAQLIDMSNLTKSAPTHVGESPTAGSLSRSRSRLGRRKSSLASFISTASSFFEAVVKSGPVEFRGFSRRAYDPYRDPGRINRIQLQRLLDSDPELLGILVQAEGMDDDIRALDIIRKYKSREAMNKKLILDNLLGSTNAHTDTTSSSSVRKGLIRVLDDTEANLKGELASMIDSSSRMAEDLLELKKAMDGYSFRRPSLVGAQSSTQPIAPRTNPSGTIARGSHRVSDDSSTLGRGSYHSFKK